MERFHIQDMKKITSVHFRWSGFRLLLLSAAQRLSDFKTENKQWKSQAAVKNVNPRVRAAHIDFNQHLKKRCQK